MITSLRLQNFRSYSDDSFEFDPTVNIVVGPNASGKTNLLEAVLVLAGLKSYKAKSADLIKHRRKWARLEGVFGNSTRNLKLFTQGNLEFAVDNSNFKRLPTRLVLPVVLFEPNQLQLVNRGPETRRDWLDDLLVRTVPGFGKNLNNYRRALAQRNRLLKNPPNQVKRQIFAWDVRLSELAGQIAAERQRLIDEINTGIGGIYRRLAGQRRRIQLAYQPQFNPTNYSSKMLAKLQTSLTLDMARGFTGSGPHREDIIFQVDGVPLTQTASRGEIRSLIIGLKIFELRLIEKIFGSKPLLLLDDVFSELDGKRRQALVNHLRDYQTIITTTDADAVLNYFAGQHKLIPLRKV